MHRFGLLCNFQRLTLTESFPKRIFWELYKVKASLQICKTRSLTSPGQWFWHCIKEFVDRHWGKMHQLMLIFESQTFTLTESVTEGIFWGLYRVEASLQTCKIPSFTFTEEWLVHCIKEFKDCAGGKMHPFWLLCKMQSFTLTQSFTERIFWGLYRVEASLPAYKIPSFTFTEQWFVHCIKEFEDCSVGKMHRFGLPCNFQRLTLTESFRKRIFWELYKVKASLQICNTQSFTSPGQWFWHCIKEFVDRHWRKMHQLMLIRQSETFTLTESFTERIFWGLYRVEANLQIWKIPSFTFTEQWLVHCIKEFEDCAGGKMHPFWLLCKMQRFTLTQSFTERIFWGLYRVQASLPAYKIPSFTFTEQWFVHCIKEFEDCSGGKMHRFGLLCNFQRLTLTESFPKRIFWELYKVKGSLQICKTPSFTSPGQWFWHCIKEFVDRHWGKMHQLMLIRQSQTFTLTESFTEGIFWGLYRVEASLQTCKIPSFTFTEEWLVHCVKEFEDCAGGKMHPFWLLCMM